MVCGRWQTRCRGLLILGRRALFIITRYQLFAHARSRLEWGGWQMEANGTFGRRFRQKRYRIAGRRWWMT